MKIAWATDVHLPTVERDAAEVFCRDILSHDCEALLLGGDIAEAVDLGEWLERLDSWLKIPTYFVLGNHDFYGSDIASVRKRAGAAHDRQFWLPAAGRVRLGNDVSLVGHDGWGDCRHGAIDDFALLTDYIAISDLGDQIDRKDLFSGFAQKGPLREKLRELGDEAAAELRGPLLEAVESNAAVLVLTHVPPFPEACWHQGQVSQGAWLPGFTCKAVGDLLLEVADSRPATHITVLCGHTHWSGHAQLRPNLEVHTGQGAYGRLSFRVLQIRQGAVDLVPQES